MTTATRNEFWGFWGTMGEQANVAWPIALTKVSEATGEDEESARAFLDSRHGRHFADTVLNAMHTGEALHQAIDTAVAQWMKWRITRSTAKEHGIPAGLPYLTGFLILEAMHAEDEENTQNA